MAESNLIVGDAQAGPDEIENLREAVQKMQEAEALQRALFAIAELAGADLEMKEVLRRVHGIVSGLMYAESFYIALHDAATDTIDYIYFVDPHTFDPPEPGMPIAMEHYKYGLTWYVLRDGVALLGPPATLQAQVSGPLHIRGACADDWLGVPMADSNGVHGVLVVQSYDGAGRFGKREQALLSFVASHVLTALQRKRAHEELERAVRIRTTELAKTHSDLLTEVGERQRGEHLQAALYRITELASTFGSMDDFYRSVHAVVGDLIRVRNLFIALLNEDGKGVHFPYFVDEKEVSAPTRPLRGGLVEYVMRTGKPLLAMRPEIDELVKQGALKSYGPTSYSWLGVPLLCEGRALGVLAVQSYHSDVRYTEADSELLTFVSYQIASSLERKRMTDSLHHANLELEQRVQERTHELQEQIAVRKRVEGQLKHRVRHDTLTGLPNRSYLLDRLEGLLARYRRDPSRRFAILFMDVDRFKVINDSMGHVAGDAVLQEVALRLSSRLRAPDMMARLGGDEFAVLVEDAPEIETVVRIARRMQSSLDEPLIVAGKTLFTSVSIGITLSDPRYPGAQDLLRNADTAMYRAKVNGRQRFELFDEDLHNDALRVLDLESALRIAITDNQIIPYFQPIISLKDGSVKGYEALMRWQHPVRGILAPGEFLKIAEDNGSIETIDWQIFALAFKAIAQYKEFSGYLSVNVSARHFRNPAFSERLMGLIRQAELPPDRLCLEITEGALIENPERASQVMHALRNLGLSLALDDFGTGYSSLSYLHQFPLTILKIDRSFVTPLQPETGTADTNNAVVRAVLALAGALGMSVVAEGIETTVQQSVLVDLGCSHGQGYLFGKPAPLPVHA